MSSDALLLLAAGLGSVTTYVGAALRQKHWPSWLNALVQNALVAVGAGIATFESNGIGTWQALKLSLLGAFTAAAAHNTLVLNATGLGSFLRDRVLNKQPTN